jgi:hypothetical protein
MTDLDTFAAAALPLIIHTCSVGRVCAHFQIDIAEYIPDVHNPEFYAYLSYAYAKAMVNESNKHPGYTR